MARKGHQPTVISIDWDFFHWNGLEAKEKTTEIDGQEVAMGLMFDWGHNEHFSADLQTILWGNRVADWQRRGLDLTKTMGIRPEVGCTTPKDFVDAITYRWDVDYATLSIFDSHAIGYVDIYTTYKNMGKPVTVYHFDAHHDMGYDGLRLKNEEKLGQILCDSWLYHAFKKKMIAELHIIYPDWRGTQEWDRSETNETLGKRIRDKIHVHTWSDWIRLDMKEETLSMFDRIGIARSSAWSPPWLDHEYLEFAASFGPIPECQDCKMDHKYSQFDACAPRDWDGIRQIADNISDMENKFLSKNGENCDVSTGTQNI